MRTTAIRQRRTMKIAGITFSLALAAAALPACGVQSEPSAPAGTTNTTTGASGNSGTRVPSQPGKRPTHDSADTSRKTSTPSTTATPKQTSPKKPGGTGTSPTNPQKPEPSTKPSTPKKPPATTPSVPNKPPKTTTPGTDENGNKPSDDGYDPEIENSALIGGNINDDVKLSKDKEQPLRNAVKAEEPGTFKDPVGVTPTCEFPAKSSGENKQLPNCPGKPGRLSGEEADNAHSGQSISQRERSAADELVAQVQKARKHYKVNSAIAPSADLDALARKAANKWIKGEKPTMPAGIEVLTVSSNVGEENAEQARPETVPVHSSIAFLLQGSTRDSLLWDTPLQVGAAVKANTDNGQILHVILIKQDRAKLKRDPNCEFPNLNDPSASGHSPFACPGVRDITGGERTKQENNKLLAAMRKDVLEQLREAAKHYNWPGTITEDNKLSTAVQDLAAHPNRKSPTYIFPHAGLELHAPGDDVLNTGSYPAETLIATLLTSYHESLPKVMNKDVNKYVGIGLAPVEGGKKLSFFISIRLDDGQGSGPCDFKEFPEAKKNAKYDDNGATSGRVNYCGAFTLPTAAESSRDINVRFDEARDRLLKQLNKIRRQAGLDEVKTVNPNLTADAQDWAVKRLLEGVNRHQTDAEFIYGAQEGEVMDDSYLPVGAGPETIKPEIIIADYLYSPHHRAAILDPDLKQVGIGIAIDSRTGKLINVINFLNTDDTPAINPNWQNYKAK